MRGGQLPGPQQLRPRPLPLAQPDERARVGGERRGMRRRPRHPLGEREQRSEYRPAAFRLVAVQPGLCQGEIGVLPEQPRGVRRDAGLPEQPVGVGEHGGRAGGGGEPRRAVQQVGFRARVPRCGKAELEQPDCRSPVAGQQQGAAEQGACHGLPPGVLMPVGDVHGLPSQRHRLLVIAAEPGQPAEVRDVIGGKVRVAAAAVDLKAGPHRLSGLVQVAGGDEQVGALELRPLQPVRVA